MYIYIMDGRYVTNYAMSLNDLRCIRSLTSKPLDVHLMVEHGIWKDDYNEEEDVPHLYRWGWRIS